MVSSPVTSWQIDGETMEIVTDYFLVPKITADGDCSHEIKRCLLLGRKAMTNLDSIFKSRDVTLPTRVRLVKAMIFPLSQWCHPTISSSVNPLPPLSCILPRIRVFSNESVLCIRWPKYWSFSFSISTSNEYSQLISFRMDWLDLLAVQGTLKSLLQHHSWKASILRCSAFFIVQLSHPYMTTGKTIALTRQIFVGKVMSLLFNMLSRLVITFLPRNKHLLISQLQSPSAVILEPKKNKVCHCFHCFPIYFLWNDGTNCHDLSFLKVEL